MPPTNFDTHQFAAQAHAGQVDKGGKPYIRHINRVAAAADKRAHHALEVDGLKINPEHVLQAAYLHDVVEDTKTVPDDLVRAGYAPEVIEMVRLLTKTDEPMNYAERITALIETRNLGAILIKLSDNEDNASIERQLPTKEDVTARYAASLPRLRDAAAALGYTGS
ncbi:HD domain-containing protein [Methylorubrum extorquens]|uniref:Putative GTP diphosphokinase n=1 Tax=Methylorubrum extorquens (strain CM4 / NCIMB 13688) TaxID=440085 RepID=B7KZU6_METC4|nr:HD domain-containing protein [Methylorubrum extorquens]ACK84877.1 putative GTP diphosphokinase [Methylorubrum extorquens CM4]